MDFAAGAEAEALRAEVRAFVREHLTADVLGRVAATGDYHDREFHAALAGRGWVGAHWHVEEGGRGWDRAMTDLIYEELASAGAPTEGLAITQIVGEAVRRVGTAEQRRRLLPPICRGELLLALGYTEPGSGSDLASVRTRAARDGAGWVINGQKIFTTLAGEADHVFLLARTDPGAPKHAGLTLFLVPTAAEGFSVAPIFTLSGQRTNVTYYSDVRVGDEARVGAEGQGWEIVNVALAFERGGEFAAQLRRLVTAAVTWGRDRDAGAGFHARLGRAAASAEVARLLGVQASWSRSSAAAGAVEGTMAKVYGTEALLRESRALLDATGVEGLPNRGAAGAAAAGELQHLYREAQIATIYGGTSEVLLTLIAQQRLGLPRGRRSTGA
ncbi:acyl-CoA dehydrogenase family protein [Actinomadura sp. 7K534]|uniref:acyl-CoA dehydrogenase family protein n=1 Tax=Actinomadura sp. 7K534 TaxID=2530366 RepID=UPI00104F5B70|nr:acyl-CoA dehydrogenase family protein [Actinomadura sp. 7K534]TDB98185.1 acyl-CoA dehydrogenase [Actinomadura sp. 7K534]